MCTGNIEPDGGYLSLLSQLFRRTIGCGWLIISGPTPEMNDRAIERLLEVVDLSRPILFLRPNDSLTLEIEEWAYSLEALLEVPLIYLDLDEVDDRTLFKHWQEAGLIVAAGGDEFFWFDFLSERMASSPTKLDLTPDQNVWFVGAAGKVLGEWTYIDAIGHIITGARWLPGAMILQLSGGLDGLEPVQDLLRLETRSYAFNLPGGATIAYGPQNEFELWGSPEPSIVLGKGWGEA